MLTQEILASSAELLGLTETKQLINSATSETEQQILKDAQVERLLSLCQFALQELCTNYLPFVNDCDLQSSNKIIPLGSLANFIRLKSVTQNGKVAKYKIINRNLVFDEDDCYTISYYTYPKLTSLFEELDFLDQYGPEVAVYALCAYYALATGRFTEFETFHEQYSERALSIRDLRIFELPQRRWV